MAQKRILCVPDSHVPWVNKSALNKIYEITKAFKPNIIVHLGDLYDFYSFSRFPRNMSVMSPKDEISRGREQAEQMWRWLQRSAPKAKCFQLMGNHCSRPIKRVMETFPEGQELFRTTDLFKFQDVETMTSERDELIIGDILFQHGFRSKLGDHCIHNNMNTVCGHSHRGGVFYTRLGNKTIWELNAGHIALEGSEPLSYTRQRQISKWTTGLGIIDELGPKFIPLENK